MIYSLTKKAALFTVLGGSAMVAAFGTTATSYLDTAVFRIRNTAKNAVPVEFEIDRAKREVEKLTPAIHRHIEILARAEEDVKRLNVEIQEATVNLDHQKNEMIALRKQLDRGNLIPASFGVKSKDVETALRNRLDSYERTERVLIEKKSTLASRQKVVEAARDHLTAIATQKKSLEARIEEIQARLAAIEATNAKQRYHFDGSALANAKKTVEDLDQRLNIIVRVSEMENQLEEDGTFGPSLPDLENVTREIDAKFGLEPATPEHQTVNGVPLAEQSVMD